MSTTTAKTVSCCSPKPDCHCPKCTGLECLERPRFFTGQLLTERELNDEQAYVLAKNRLHNLHLHGWGVVCGLEVVCHECEGWVTVRPGYAIDPCGNDVIICQEHAVNVLEEIRRCKKRRHWPDCRPIRPRPDPPQPDPSDSTIPPTTPPPPVRPPAEHWCLTLHYCEAETKPTTALRREDCRRCGCGPHQSCSCSCHGGPRQSSGCSCQGEKGAGCSCGCSEPSRVRRGVGKTVAPCEPTRILETYRLELCEMPEGFCDDLESEAEKAYRKRLDDCAETLQRSFAGIPQESMNLLGSLLSAGLLFDVNAQDAHLACRQVHEFVTDLYRRGPGVTHCAALKQLDALFCPPPNPDEPLNSYWQRIEGTVRQILALAVRYLVDCVCVALLPPCAPCCPGDDLLILACLTVRDGCIEDICNYSCRRYAGAFPPSVGGFYLGPLMPLITRYLKELCCGDLLDRVFQGLGQETGTAFSDLLDTRAFSAPALISQALRADPATLLNADLGQSVRLSSFVGRPVAEVEQAGEEAGVRFNVRQVERLPRARLLSAVPPAARGDEITVFARDDRILGFARTDSPEETLVAQAAEIESLRGEIRTLRDAVERLHPPYPRDPQ